MTVKKIKPGDVYISHYLFRNLDKPVRKDVLKCAWRDDVIGCTLDDAAKVILKGADDAGLSERFARATIKSLREGIIALKAQEGAHTTVKKTAQTEVKAAPKKTVKKTVKVPKKKVASASRTANKPAVKRVAKKREKATA